MGLRKKNRRLKLIDIIKRAIKMHLKQFKGKIFNLTRPIFKINLDLLKSRAEF